MILVDTFINPQRLPAGILDDGNIKGLVVQHFCPLNWPRCKASWSKKAARAMRMKMKVLDLNILILRVQ
jgi:hypothetical protein